MSKPPNAKHSLFRYKAGNSALHRLPAWIKILIVPALNLIFFFLPVPVIAGCIFLQCVAARAAGFSFKEQLEDMRPLLYYAVLLYCTQFLTLSFSAGALSGFKAAVTNPTTLIMLGKLFCIIQSASLMFKTSTSLEIREGIGTIESAIRRYLPCSKKNSFTNTLSLFVCFIPMVHTIWEQTKRAWIARHGKQSIKMYATLIPVLFSVGMKKAYNSAKAILARS